MGHKFSELRVAGVHFGCQPATTSVLGWARAICIHFTILTAAECETFCWIRLVCTCFRGGVSALPSVASAVECLRLFGTVVCTVVHTHIIACIHMCVFCLSYNTPGFIRAVDAPQDIDIAESACQTGVWCRSWSSSSSCMNKSIFVMSTYEQFQRPQHMLRGKLYIRAT